MDIQVTVNGRTLSAAVDERTLLLDLVRETAGLTGTHAGCMEARCGTCTVLVDGHAVKSCNVLALQVDGREVTTIEGLSGDGDSSGNGLSAWTVPESLHPIQAAFHEAGAVQCGYCVNGFILTLSDLLQQNPEPTEEQLRDGIRGNLCRCTGYQKIVEAGLDAAARLREAPM